MLLGALGQYVRSLDALLERSCRKARWRETLRLHGVREEVPAEPAFWQCPAKVPDTSEPSHTPRRLTSQLSFGGVIQQSVTKIAYLEILKK